MIRDETLTETYFPEHRAPDGLEVPGPADAALSLNASTEEVMTELFDSRGDASEFTEPPEGGRLTVSPEGEIRHQAVGRLSQVTEEAFGVEEPARRELLSEWRRRRQAADGQQVTGISATPDGNIVFADRTTDSDRRLAKVTPETFGSWIEAAAELVTAMLGVGGAAQAAPPTPQDRDLLPSSAEWIAVGTTHGWLFSFTNDHGDEYVMFLFQRPSNGRYYVQLVEPKPSLFKHQHMLNGGILCLTTRPEHGCESVEHAYGRAVAWSLASSHWARTGRWLFN